jgi:hypothetical protein
MYFQFFYQKFQYQERFFHFPSKQSESNIIINKIKKLFKNHNHILLQSVSSLTWNKIWYFLRIKGFTPLHASATSIGTAPTILDCWRKAGGDETTPIWRRNADTRVKQAALYGEAEKQKVNHMSCRHLGLLEKGWRQRDYSHLAAKC